MRFIIILWMWPKARLALARCASAKKKSGCGRFCQECNLPRAAPGAAA